LISLPDEVPDGIGTFISWVYTGRISSTLTLQALWVMGDRIRSPSFPNDIMSLMFDYYGVSDPATGSPPKPLNTHIRTQPKALR
jgi:hypothetical protein